jgi:hypothetical protein
MMGNMPEHRAVSRPTAPARYYEHPLIRRAMLEYCGDAEGERPSAAYVVGLDAAAGPLPTWDHGPLVPVAEISRLWDAGSDISRAMWDGEHLLFLLDIDYQNIDQPAEPYLRPAEAFFKLEPTYRAIMRLFKSYGIASRPLITGRGYQFTGRIPLTHPVVDRLAAFVPGVPGWFETLEARRPAGVVAPMSPRHARAAAGLGAVIEYLAHQILIEAQPESRVPVVLNGTHVGGGTLGRECSSIDFSHAGDPLDTRHMRVAFSTYQWHRLRPDIFGMSASAVVPPLAAVPRGRESLVTVLARGHDLDAALRLVVHHPPLLPDIAEGIDAAAAGYTASSLAAFHREFFAALDTAEPITGSMLDSLPACIRWPIDQPNDLLLRPEHIQHVVRGLLARQAHPSAIARLVQTLYEQDHGWGDRWTRMHAPTRAAFDVRVFAGLVRTGTDRLIDFNCVSAQEKDLCPRLPCGHDLRRDADLLRPR